MTPQVGNKVQIHGMITLMRKGKWRKTAVGEAFGRVTQLKHNGMLVVSVPDYGDCLIHTSAITLIEHEITLTLGGKPLAQALEDHSEDAAKYLGRQVL